MKKIINRPEDLVEQMMRGLVSAHDNIVHRVGTTRVVARNYEGKGKVGLISGGGSGHEPSHAGFVGKGMLSAAVCGDVFTSPTVDEVHNAIVAANKGAGVLMVIKNYTGDVVNFQMAAEQAEEEGIKVDYCITSDDIAVENSTWTTGQRGVAGTIFVHKILGALAEEGKDLKAIKAESDRLIPEIKTLGLALSPATTPASGKPGFELADDEIEFGIGIHGEPGYEKVKLKTSAEMAKEFYVKIKNSFGLKADDKVVVLVNGMGATPLMEQYVFFNDVMELFAKDHITVAKKMVGDYMTSIDMAGMSLTVLRLKDPKWLELLNREA
ncbi:MAG: dihydroxyacetone kinase subunit DhaK, partial [Erysipelotrichaceae bacterium]